MSRGDCASRILQVVGRRAVSVVRIRKDRYAPIAHEGIVRYFYRYDRTLTVEARAGTGDSFHGIITFSAYLFAFLYYDLRLSDRKDRSFEEF